MQFGVSLQVYPGSLGTWGGMQEGLYVHRTSTNELYTTYSQELYGQPGHCVAPCVLGQRFIPEDTPTIERSTRQRRRGELSLEAPQQRRICAV